MSRFESSAEEALPSPSPAFYEFSRFVVANYIRARGGLNIVNEHNFRHEGPAVITGSHDKKTDPFAIGIVYPDILTILGKKELWSWKYLYAGKLLGKLGTVALDRAGGHTAMRTGSRVTLAGRDVLTFLQGTRKHKNGDIEGKDGVAWLALRAASTIEEPCPVIPVGLSTSAIKMGNPIQEVVGPPIMAEPGNSNKSGRKALTNELETAVHDLRRVALELDAEGAGKRFHITHQQL